MKRITFANRVARFLACLGALMTLGILPANGQNIDSYLSDMREALVPVGTLAAISCHSVEIELNGPWTDLAVPTGAYKDKQLQWLFLSADVRRLYVNLSDLDEDQVKNQALFSAGYLSKHQQGSRYVPDTPAVMFSTRGLNTHMTVHVVDLDKVHALRGHLGTESQMGVSMDERKLMILPLSDQFHADAFQKALQKAIVLCKAQ